MPQPSLSNKASTPEVTLDHTGLQEATSRKKTQDILFDLKVGLVFNIIKVDYVRSQFSLVFKYHTVVSF